MYHAICPGCGAEVFHMGLPKNVYRDHMLVRCPCGEIVGEFEEDER